MDQRPDWRPSWLKLGARKSRPAPPGHRIYAVGDIHGRLDLLEQITGQIRDHARGAQAEVIFLGDYIDRGPESARVVDFLIDDPFGGAMACTFLKGNHEATLLDFLVNPAVGPAWMQYGGGETLMSYGVRAPLGKSDEAGWAEASQALTRILPGEHVGFYQRLQVSAERGLYFFAHAGVDPDRPLENQDEASLLWVREPFLNDTRKLSRVIVHGHTPASMPYADERRIGLDTGAYQTGKLTAACLERGSVTFLSTA